MNDGSLGYLTKEGFRNIYVNRLMSIASVSVLFSCLVMIGSAFLLLVNINSLIAGLEQQNVIMVFVKDDASTMQTEELGKQISSLENVKSSKFIPKDEAFKEQLEELGDAAELFKGMDKNPLPDSYKVTIDDMNLFSGTVEKLKNLDNVLSVTGNGNVANKLNSLRSSVSYISIGIISMLLFVSLFIISNTVRITMFSRRLEISIMKSVGATSWFIRWPFMLEGMLLGAFSGILATFAVWGVYKTAFRPFLNMLSSLGKISVLPFSSYAAVMFFSFVLIGIAAGAFGSTVSIGKYLKEQECAGFEE